MPETNNMNQRTNFLALILLDALDDEDESNIYKILEQNNVDASYVPNDRGIAPLHYACGMQNERLAYEITARFLDIGANPNVCSNDNMTPLHVAAIYGRLSIVKILLQHGADLYAVDDERKMPVHYAIEECHFEVVTLMRDHIFLNKYEKHKEMQQKQKQPINILQDITVKQQQQQQEQEQLGQSKFEVTILRAETERISTPKSKGKQQQSSDNSINLVNKHLNNKSLAVADNNETEKYTPNRVHYNYDVTSPYYINITHRRNKPQPLYPAEIKKNLDAQPAEYYQNMDDMFNPLRDAEAEAKETEVTKAVNIFSLTRQNLQELSQLSPQGDRTGMSVIETWRERVRRSRARQSILKVYDDVSELIDSVMESDHLNFTNTELREKSLLNTSKGEQCGVTKKSFGTPNMSLGELIQRVAQAQLVGGDERSAGEKISPVSKATNSSYQTVPEMQNGEYYLQMTEEYVHTDDENGLVFYETKLLSNPANKKVSCNERKKLAIADTTATTQSTNITLPLDYETDALRAELTTFGEPPGPITKSTKRLYIKRLVKYKRKTEYMQERAKQANNIHEKKFSIELYRTLRSEENFQNVLGFMEYERQSAEYFANKKNANKMREGHLKQSFIYMLIDPRISNNLPGESAFLNKFDTWKQFLKSIFYVGKGKSSRPYAHLYEAMKTHSRMHYEKMNKDKPTALSRKALLKNMPLDAELFKSPPAFSSESKKLDHILDVWASEKGVVCLHVFHNILAIEAYTREAAIIDALSLQHLTNVKRGQYYGPAKTWTMKAKKHFGIALLYKAMLIYLAEGESQLSPSDLI